MADIQGTFLCYTLSSFKNCVEGLLIIEDRIFVLSVEVQPVIAPGPVTHCGGITGSRMCPMFGCC